MFDLATYLSERKKQVEYVLDQLLPAAETPPGVIHEAMRYAIFAGGKRLRPILCMAASEAVGSTAARAERAGAAIEALHTYTLIHDDLPCMDDDDLRRGQPTAHIKFGEANAVLAGDALLTQAFEWLATEPATAPYQPCQLALELAQAAGSRGVIGGQVEDMAAEGDTPTAERVNYIHTHKTAALFRASTRIGAIVGNAAPIDLEQLTLYGLEIGRAFQITDDILNATSSEEAMGKPVGNDQEAGKMSYLSIHSLEEARANAKRLISKAINALEGLPGDTQALVAIAEKVLTRTN